MDIRSYFNTAKTQDYNEALIQNYIKDIDIQHNNGAMKELKWKINRKAANILIEIANPGAFHWKLLSNNIYNTTLEIENIKVEYIHSLHHRNLSKSTIELHDYVFRKVIYFTKIETSEELQFLSADKIQVVITELSKIYSKQSIATILPIVRGLIKFLVTII